MGLMSKVFGLHLLKNGISIEGVTKEELVSDIVSTQQEDGGWTLFTVSDVDVTAMCLQALSGECEQEYITKAVTFLSQKQLSDGTFISMGVSNCESCAQVIIALSALGIDGNTDERFIKEKSAYEGLLSFKTSGGLFCHVAGGEYKESSTVQALSALVSYKLYKEGRGAFYAIPDYRFGEMKKTAEKVNLPVNVWVAVGIAGVAVLLCVVLLVTKKGGWKEITVIVVVACGLALFIGLSTFQTVDEYYADSPYQGETVSVYVSIRKDVVDPLSPVIFSDTVDVKKDGNVLDAMIVATRKGKLQFSYVTGYISSIDNLAEFSYGNESGWLFAVNGVFSDRSCSEKKINEGDKICFLYTVKMGKDVSDFFEVHDEY